MGINFRAFRDEDGCEALRTVIIQSLKSERLNFGREGGIILW